MGTGGFNLNYFDLVRADGAPSSRAIAPASLPRTSLNIASPRNAVQQEQTINGGSGIDTVSYRLLPMAIAANLKTGSVTYGLKSNGDSLKIMPLGDSITRGEQRADTGFRGHDPGSYRDDLWGLLSDAGYDFDFVGKGELLSGDNTPDTDHAGVAGETIRQIAERTLGNEGLLSTFQPDAILLMAGTNDVFVEVFDQRDRYDLASNRLSAFLGDIQERSPQTQVFLASIPPMMTDPRYNNRVTEYNRKIREEVVGRHANTTFVDVSNRLTLSDIYDGIHPDRAGNRKVAQAWYEAIEAFYPEGKGGSSPYVDKLNSIENLIGTDYNDTLIGSDTANTLVGGKGDDILTGGRGADKFVVALDGSFDTITDFQVGIDKIVLSNSASFGSIYANSGADYGYSAADTVLLNNMEQIALLSGVQSSLIDASSFAIA